MRQNLDFGHTPQAGVNIELKLDLESLQIPEKTLVMSEKSLAVVFTEKFHFGQL